MLVRKASVVVKGYALEEHPPTGSTVCPMNQSDSLASPQRTRTDSVNRRCSRVDPCLRTSPTAPRSSGPKCSCSGSPADTGARGAGFPGVSALRRSGGSRPSHLSRARARKRVFHVKELPVIVVTTGTRCKAISCEDPAGGAARPPERWPCHTPGGAPRLRRLRQSAPRGGLRRRHRQRDARRRAPAAHRAGGTGGPDACARAPRAAW